MCQLLQRKERDWEVSNSSLFEFITFTLNILVGAAIIEAYNENAGTWYTVTVGRQVGVYQGWWVLCSAPLFKAQLILIRGVVGAMVNGCPHNNSVAGPTYAEAVMKFRNAVARGAVRIVALAGG